MLTSQELCELCGIGVSTLANWVDNRFVIPTKRGIKGNKIRPHMFSDRQAVGLTIANVLRRSEQGCSRAYVRMIVKFFEDMEDEQFQRWMFPDGGQLTPPPWADPNAPELPGAAQVKEQIFKRLADVEPVLKVRKRLTERGKAVV